MHHLFRRCEGNDHSAGGIIALTEKAKTTPKPGETAGAAGQNTPEATPEEADGGPIGDFACFATASAGITCLSSQGWKTYTEDNTDFYNLSVEDMNACPDGKIYAVTYSTMLVFDGSRWKGIPVAGEEYRGGQLCCLRSGWKRLGRGVRRRQPV